MRFTVLLLALSCAITFAADNAVVAPQSATGPKPQATTYGAEAITIPQMLSYQGRLTDTLGVPVPDGNYQLTFRLYTQPTGGSAIWTEGQTIQVVEGLFSALLGSVTPIASMPDGGALYLGLQVAVAPELVPRLRIASAAYAYLTARAADADLLQGRDTTTFSRSTHNHDATYVNEAQADAVTGAMLVDGTVLTADVGDTAVTMAKIAQAGATTGQVVKWTGSAWAPGQDNTGGGSGVTDVYQDTGIICVPNPITSSGNVKLNLSYSDGRYVNTAGDSMTGALAVQGDLRVYGKGRIGPSNSNAGTAAFVAGSGNTASANYSSVAGGTDNAASGVSSHVGGGSENQASGSYSFVGGGEMNYATGVKSAIGGGVDNQAVGLYSMVGGGDANTAGDAATDTCAVVAGGYGNRAIGRFATVGGGQNDTASGNWSTVGGGRGNAADTNYATVGGGWSNNATGYASTVSGGNSNTADTNYATVSGGYSNDATGDYATVGGGDGNAAETAYATVGGGYQSDATGYAATVGGGYWNHADSAYATVGGGQQNEATDTYATVGGGWGNQATGAYATVGGGRGNAADTSFATVGGGRNNYATGYAATVGGGYLNFATGSLASVLGGTFCLASGNRSFAAGSYAKAHGAGSFVWSDSCGSSADSVGTTTDNRWVARARGGVYFYTDLDKSTGSYLSAGGSSWQSVSDSMTKENFRPVDKQALLEVLARMRVRDYNLKTQDQSIRHIGPVAQDFHGAFGFGESNMAINMEDADGVALAAIQALYEQNQSLSRRVAELEAKLSRE